MGGILTSIIPTSNNNSGKMCLSLRHIGILKEMCRRKKLFLKIRHTLRHNIFLKMCLRIFNKLCLRGLKIPLQARATTNPPINQTCAPHPRNRSELLRFISRSNVIISFTISRSKSFDGNTNDL